MINRYRARVRLEIPRVVRNIQMDDPPLIFYNETRRAEALWARLGVHDECHMGRQYD